MTRAGIVFIQGLAIVLLTGTLMISCSKRKPKAVEVPESTPEPSPLLDDGSSTTPPGDYTPDSPYTPDGTYNPNLSGNQLPQLPTLPQLPQINNGNQFPQINNGNSNNTNNTNNTGGGNNSNTNNTGGGNNSNTNNTGGSNNSNKNNSSNNQQSKDKTNGSSGELTMTLTRSAGGLSLGFNKDVQQISYEWLPLNINGVGNAAGYFEVAYQPAMVVHFTVVDGTKLTQCSAKVADTSKTVTMKTNQMDCQP